MLVTPVERVGIVVEDAPFLGVELLREGEGASQILRLRTNVDDWVEISPEHPLKFLPGDSGGLKPYVLVRGDLWALVNRALFYDLVAWGEPRTIDGEDMFGVFSGGGFFAMAPMRDLAAPGMSADDIAGSLVDAEDFCARARRSCAKTGRTERSIRDAGRIMATTS